MAKYRKVENCGRVPYPDRSGKFLNAGEVVEGDDWAPLVALGYVVEVAAPPAPVVEKAPEAPLAPVAKVTKVDKKTAVKIETEDAKPEEPKADTITEEI